MEKNKECTWDPAKHGGQKCPVHNGVSGNDLNDDMSRKDGKTWTEYFDTIYGEDIDKSNQAMEDLEKSLPFKDEKEHEQWISLLDNNRTQEWEELTKEIAGRKDQPKNEGVFNIPTIHESLKKDIEDGEITLEEAGKELIRAGWYSYLPDEKEIKRALKIDDNYKQPKLKERINEQQYNDLIKKDFSSLTEDEKESLIRFLQYSGIYKK